MVMQCVSKKLYKGIPNVTVWRVSRKRDREVSTPLSVKVLVTLTTQ
jgi:hypothetical protein